MQINQTMDQSSLIDFMGDVHVTLAQAEAVRELLVRDFNGRDTSEVPRKTWMLYRVASDSTTRVFVHEEDVVVDTRRTNQ